jgi:KDO2-lipid IV(A) lauroyltransferase
MANSRRARPRSLYAPRYWPTWLGLGLLWPVTRMPYPAMIALGRWVGRIARHLLRARRHIAEVNIRMCFPERTASEREALVRAHFEAVGIGLFEAALCWWGSDAVLRRLVQVEGLEHAHAARGRGKGFIMLCGHFTTLEITGRMLGLYLGRVGVVMYRRNENPVLERVLSRSRARYASQAIHRSDVKGMLKCLRQNLGVWYAPDQRFMGKHRLMAPFFNHPAWTNGATSRIARVSGAAVLPFAGYRLPGTQGYRLVIGPPLEDFPTDDVVADTARINRVIEGAVRLAPEQYYWIHRRFKLKRREPDPY